MRFTRKLLAIFVVLMLAFSTMPVIVTASDEITVTIDGVPVDFEGQGPILTGGRTLVPVRGVFEVLGFYPTWNRSTRTATLTRDDYVVVLTIGSYTFTTNGEEFELDVPAQLIGGRTLLPLRAVLESVGYSDMRWVSSTRTVVIRTGIDEPVPSPTPAATATPTPSPTPAPDGEQTLIGAWGYGPFPVLIFREDGSGFLGDIEIGWTAENGILGLCNTPDLCRDNCPAPGEWYYSFDGDMLILESLTLPDADMELARVHFQAPIQPVASRPLVGSWSFLGLPSMELRPDNTGFLVLTETEINWTSSNGRLEICVSPNLCKGNCIGPDVYYYTITGDQLRLEFRSSPGTTTIYDTDSK
ncbi:MAG: copper amine oxidase N-terminal domain-containing protein [Defluviitaleaceae bacterium]|nr:copper amine oxidase N-terminal domain-containing protein [Defluviitaleaceae bacterium]